MTSSARSAAPRTTKRAGGVRAVPEGVVEQRQRCAGAAGAHVAGPGRRVPVTGLLVDHDLPRGQHPDEADAVVVTQRLERDILLALTRQVDGADLVAALDAQTDLAVVQHDVTHQRADGSRHDQDATSFVERGPDQPVVPGRSQPHDRRRPERVDPFQRSPRVPTAAGDADPQLPGALGRQARQHVSGEPRLEGHVLVVELGAGNGAEDVDVLGRCHLGADALAAEPAVQPHLELRARSLVGTTDEGPAAQHQVVAVPDHSTQVRHPAEVQEREPPTDQSIGRADQLEHLPDAGVR